MNHAEMIKGLQRHAAYLNPKQKALLKENTIEAYEEIFNSIKAPNIFVPKYTWERGDIFKTMTRLWSDPNHIYMACRDIFGIELAPFQIVMMEMMLNYKYPMIIAARGFGKSFLLGLFTMYVMLFDQGCKVVIAGAGLRQSKVIFGYMKKIYNSGGLLRELVPNQKEPVQGVNECTYTLGRSTAIGLPIGDGEKIRGQRSNYLLIDEFKSLSEDIYERVLAPFGSVAAEPVKKMKEIAYQDLMTDLGYDIPQINDIGNRSIISGTADYEFNHFCKYWKTYKQIIQSGGNYDRLCEIFNGEPQEGFNWKNYAIARVPVELLPPGFMDAENVARAKLTSSTTLYANEYGACFVKDTAGFFPRTLIEECVATANREICTANYTNISFEPLLEGYTNREYVIAVDAASEKDNFAITILELWSDHRRVVYCWTITRKKYMEQFKQGDLSFYGYCARHILNLKKTFKTNCIVIDAQGGGRAIAEELHSPLILQDGELPLWPVRIDGKKQQTDSYVGEHVLYLIEFSNRDWVYNANHDLKKDMGDKVLLFPSPTAAQATVATMMGMNKDTTDYENVIWNIEEMKDELTIIVCEKTPTGVDKWDVPKIKGPESVQKKGKLKKDRYSALLMANAEGRKLNPRRFEKREYDTSGFSIIEDIPEVPDKRLYAPHPWFNDNFGGMVVR